MKKLTLLGSSALRSMAFIGATTILAGPAFAQTANQDQDPPETLESEVEAQSGQDAQPESGATITVTGSRIRQPNVQSAIPITSIGGEEFVQSGQTNIGDTLNELPQLRSTFAQQNPGAGVGIAGLNLLDLRGLGTARTLVLVNGRRHVPADILNNAVSPDINTIPNDLIERVDIVTGGNSAVYGSDAIAGVVNFVLRRDFQGFQVRGNAAIAGEGFGASQYVSAMYGTNFGEGRGNVTLHGEYARSERVFGSDIPWFREAQGLAVVDIDPSGSVNGSDGIPDRVFIRDQRSTTVNFRGLVPITQPAANPACGLGVGTGAGGTGGSPFNCTFIFDSAGRLQTQTGTRFGQGITGGITGGNGSTTREGIQLSVLPFLERMNFNLLAHYEFADALELFAEAKWNRVNARGNNAGPSFINAQQTQLDFRERIRLDNPFLAPADRQTLAAAILASGCNTSFTAACSSASSAVAGPLTTQQRADIAAGTYRFAIAKRFLDVGLRDEQFQRDTYRFVVGARGTFNEDWNYELSANYGKFEENTTTFGYLDRQRIALALDAGRDPATGQIRCRSQFDPAAAVRLTRTDLSAAQNAAFQARLAADIAACVPYNPFGEPDNSAARAYVEYNATHQASLDQLVLQGFVSGDSSQLFELPGGPVRFALGAEYRREKAFYDNDDYVESGATNALVIGAFNPDPFEVKEAFGEIQIPILSETPFFHELTVSAAGRVADYGDPVGVVYSYNAGVEWAPIRDLRFRGNYSRAVRAPNVAETAFPQVPNFANNFLDPCRSASIGTGTTNRPTNCAADLGPLLSNIANLQPYSLPIISGSNPNLEEETSDSYTLGAVFQPRFLPGFSLSVDYYDITVNNVIVSLNAQNIANLCYDSPSLDNQFCALFTRYRGPAPGPFGELSGQILGNSLTSAGVNFASRVRRGIDLNLAYRTNLSDNIRLDTTLIYTHTLFNSNYNDPANPTFENRVLGELGDPKDEFRFDMDLSIGEFTLGYTMRYIGEMYVNNYEDFNSLQGRPPQDLDFADIIEFPIVTYHNLRFEWNIDGDGGFGRDLRFYVGADNIFNEIPPLGITATGAGPGAVGNAGIYDIRGRNFYAGFRARF